MIAEPECYRRNCKHFLGYVEGTDGEKDEYINCLAFPKGIPDYIADGTNLHNEPIKGDNGIQFEKGSEKEEQEVVD